MSIKGPATEFVAGTLRGYRLWRHGTNAKLYPVNAPRPQPWGPGEQIAICPLFNYQKYHVPASGCDCGFYGVYHPYNKELMEIFLQTAFKGRTGTVVPLNEGARARGVIEAYGKIIMGEWGFRAEKARIIAVTFDIHTACSLRYRHILISQFSDQYPNVRIYKSYKELLLDYPPTQNELKPRPTPDDWRRFV